MGCRVHEFRIYLLRGAIGGKIFCKGWYTGFNLISLGKGHELFRNLVAWGEGEGQ